MKKIIFIFLIILLMGCSQDKTVVGPSSEEGELSSLDKQLKDEFGGESIEDAIDDFENKVKDDIEALDVDEMTKDFENKLKDDLEALDIDEMTKDFEKKLKDDLESIEEMTKDFENKLKDDIESLDIAEMTKNFEEELKKDLEFNDDDSTTDSKDTTGSCNAISKTSTCIDYIGDFWTEEQMKLSCSYSGEFSNKSCESGNIGGCNVGKGSFSDMIIWMYPYGGAPISADTVESAEPSCNINPLGTWVNAK